MKNYFVLIVLIIASIKFSYAKMDRMDMPEHMKTSITEILVTTDYIGSDWKEDYLKNEAILKLIDEQIGMKKGPRPEGPNKEHKGKMKHPPFKGDRPEMKEGQDKKDGPREMPEHMKEEMQKKIKELLKDEDFLKKLKELVDKEKEEKKKDEKKTEENNKEKKEKIADADTCNCDAKKNGAAPADCKKAEDLADEVEDIIAADRKDEHRRGPGRDKDRLRRLEELEEKYGDLSSEEIDKLLADKERGDERRGPSRDKKSKKSRRGKRRQFDEDEDDDEKPRMAQNRSRKRRGNKRSGGMPNRQRRSSQNGQQNFAPFMSSGGGNFSLYSGQSKTPSSFWELYLMSVLGTTGQNDQTMSFGMPSSTGQRGRTMGGFAMPQRGGNSFNPDFQMNFGQGMENQPMYDNMNGNDELMMELDFFRNFGGSR